MGKVAIDKERTGELIEQIRSIFEPIIMALPAEVRGPVESVLMKPLFGLLQEFVSEARPPVFLFMGRSGHGKSTLVNALVGRKVAKVNPVKPESPSAEPYLIDFPGKDAHWTAVDTRGIFESTKPEGAIKEDALEVLKTAIDDYKPDVFLHVIAATEVRNMKKDFEAVEEIRELVRRRLGREIPFLAIINKCDGLGDCPKDWPPEEFPAKSKLIFDVQKCLAQDVLDSNEVKYLDSRYREKGFWLDGDHDYVAIVPTSCIEDEPWNLDTLSDVIYNKLPNSALLDFVQAQGRKDELLKMSRKITRRCAAIAGGIGAIPIPIPDIALLLPLQTVMVALIGGLSCRQFSVNTAKEFLAAIGVNVGAGYALREASRQLIKIMPAGFAVSAGVAATGTLAIGKAAESYFFKGKLVKPDMFYDEVAGTQDI